MLLARSALLQLCGELLVAAAFLPCVEGVFRYTQGSKEGDRSSSSAYVLIVHDSFVVLALELEERHMGLAT
jgi:hypothetical protein